MLCTVEILGFSAADQKSLAATLVLSLRRQVMYSQWFAGHPKPPGLLLVDSDNPQATQIALSRNLAPGYPVVLVSVNPPGDPSCVYVQRPIRFLSLFNAFDEALRHSRPPGDISALSDEPGSPSNAQKNSWAPTAPASMFTPLEPITIYDLTEIAPYAAAAAVQAPAVAVQRGKNVVSLASSFERPAMTRASAQTRSRQDDAVWVLVVDDHLAIRRFMESKLSQLNINVDYAASGEQAVGLAGAKRYSCVFLDVVMPGIDGYKVCKVIKSMAASAQTRVVMLTSRDGTFDKIRGKMAGCDAYLTKPIDEKKLIATINRVLPSINSVSQSSLKTTPVLALQPKAYRRAWVTWTTNPAD